MSELDKRQERIRSLWQTKTESGVEVFPLRASVEAMVNRGFAMPESQRLLVLGEELYRNGDLDKLLAVAAQINREIHVSLNRGDQGETAFDALFVRLHEPVKSVEGQIPSGVYLDKLKGAWVGKCIGVALGDPVEGWTAQMIRDRYGRVTDYVAQPRIANDDTAYQVLVLHALDEHGPAFTSEELALEWVEHLPHAFTAEWVALENVKAGLMPPESGWFRNPCAEWVGAQMRSEIHGLLAPLRPRVAAESAFRDAIISHRGEGLYGGVYCAVLTSLAFSGRPIEEVLKLALTWVPANSHFRQLVEATLYWCIRLGEPQAVLQRVQEELDRYHWIHTLPNIATVVVGLCLGEGDFERSVLTTLHCGFDTDCSTGQTAALLGTMLGWERLPDRWKLPIGDEFRSYVIGFERLGFDELSEWTARWGRRLTRASVMESENGGPRRGDWER